MTHELPKTIKAAVLEILGEPLVIRDLEVPTLLPGQVLVKLYFSGVCRSQLMEVQGKRGADPWPDQTQRERNIAAGSNTIR